MRRSATTECAVGDYRAKPPWTRSAASPTSNNRQSPYLPQLQRQGFTPSNPFIQAVNYVRERRVGLEVFLTDPDVPIDTNHLERALRVVPMGRRSWLFCWTELGAKHVGIIHSLIVTCRLHGIDPYTCLVDVLQRISEHPASRVAELTPRLCKQHFAANPLRSDLHDFPG